MQPYYSHNGIEIYHADNRDVLPSLSGVGLILTSPPYNLGVTSGGGFNRNMRNLVGGRKGSKWDAPALAFGYGEHGDALPYPQYVAWQKEVLMMCWNTLSDTGAIYYQHKPRIQDKLLQTPLDLNPGLPLRQIIIWRRAGGINFSPTHYCPTHEWIVIYAKDGFQLKSRAASGVGDVWEIPQEANTPHPAPFPLDLALTAIETSGTHLVVDPFSGWGTTLVAAKRLGIPAIGIELSERFCEMAARRLGAMIPDDSPGLLQFPDAA